MHRQDAEDSAVFIRKESCPKCGSRDNLARYSDGHAWCFGCGYREKGEGMGDAEIDFAPARKESGFVQDLAYQPLRKREIQLSTCQHFGYAVGRHRGKSVQVAQYRHADSAAVAAQHLRTPDKDFPWLGDKKEAQPLWGMHLWRDNGKRVVITEGEIDAMSVSQAQGNSWPVVSVASGAKGARKDIARAMEWLLRFDEVVFMFDMDEVGQEAAKECARMLPPGRAKIAILPEPFKDANDMLQAGQVKEIVDCIWGAREFRPDGIVKLDDILDDVRKPIVQGVSWPWPSLTELTYGRRPGELYALGAGTGVGKTDVFSECIAHDTVALGIPTAVFAFEALPSETAKRVAGKVGNRPFHIPGETWTDEELDKALFQMMQGGNLYLYDSWGATDWEAVESTVEYLHAAHGVQHFYVDHLTAFAAADAEKERTVLEDVMARMAKLTKRLGIITHFVSHLATPDGKPHEEGGRVAIRHFKGSRAIGFWSHFMFGLERDQQADEKDERRTTTFRVLKDRYTGRATGHTFDLYFDDVGRLTENVPSANPFKPDNEYEDIPF